MILAFFHVKLFSLYLRYNQLKNVTSIFQIRFRKLHHFKKITVKGERKDICLNLSSIQARSADFLNAELL